MRGFTLLEVLVVLALIGFMAALVAPRLQRTYEAIARSGDRAEALRQFERLPLVAREQGSPILVPAGYAMLSRYVALPTGWSATAIDPLRVDANGVCHGGRVRVVGGGSTETWSLAAPGCGIDDAP